MTYTTVPRSRPRIPQRYGSRWPPSLRLTPAMSESVGSGAGEQLVERRYRRVVGQADALAAAGPRAPHEARGARFTVSAAIVPIGGRYDACGSQSGGSPVFLVERLPRKGDHLEPEASW